MRSPPPPDLITVYTGSHGSVSVLEGILQAEGIPSLVPDRLTKTLDPFITGSSPLDLRLQVPSDRLAGAREIVTRAFPAPKPLAPRRVRVRWLRAIALLVLPTVLLQLLALLDALGI